MKTIKCSRFLITSLLAVTIVAGSAAKAAEGAGRSVESYRKAAEQGDAYSQSYLGEQLSCQWWLQSTHHFFVS